MNDARDAQIHANLIWKDLPSLSLLMGIDSLRCPYEIQALPYPRVLFFVSFCYVFIGRNSRNSICSHMHFSLPTNEIFGKNIFQSRMSKFTYLSDSVNCKHNQCIFVYMYNFFLVERKRFEKCSAAIGVIFNVVSHLLHSFSVKASANQSLLLLFDLVERKKRFKLILMARFKFNVRAASKQNANNSSNRIIYPKFYPNSISEITF